MKIIEYLSQHRNDFTATIECEHCSHTRKLITGYNDDNYHYKVMPAIKCEQCGKSRNDILEIGSAQLNEPGANKEMSYWSELD